MMLSAHRLPLFLSTLLLLLFNPSALGQELESSQTSLRGGRQLQSIVEYVFDVQDFYTWPDDFEFVDISLEEVRNVVRLSQVFYRRIMASAYGGAYWQVSATFIDAVAVGANPLRIELDMTVTVEFRASAPSASDTLSTMRNIDTGDYLRGFVTKATPGVLFPE